MMNRRTYGLRLGGVVSLLALGACQSLNSAWPTNDHTPDTAAVTPLPQVQRTKVAALLPLSGPNAALGHAMLKAIELALDTKGAPQVVAEDTGGTPEGALHAAQRASAAQAQLVLGPLTASETAAVAPVAQAAHVPVLAFTSDSSQARGGIWTLGLTPAQQVRRMVAAVQSQGKTHLAALLPNNAFGLALAQAYTQTAAKAGLPAPRIRYYAALGQPMIDAMKDLADRAHRRGARETQLSDLRARVATDPALNVQLSALESQTVPPPPFDVLLLAESGDRLQQVIPYLADNDINASDVRVLGPALWASEAPRLSALAGGWYAAPDPALRGNFVQLYQAKYRTSPPNLVDLAYDAGSLARVLAPSGYTLATLTQNEGFSGVDGVFALLPDGHVRRGLALFELGRGESQMVEPSPQSISAPGI